MPVFGKDHVCLARMLLRAKRPMHTAAEFGRVSIVIIAEVVDDVLNHEFG
jgi:hypothetical protein